MPVLSHQIEPPGWMTDPAVLGLFDLFRTKGWELRFVGGCVRDAVLDVEPADVDVASPVEPETAMAALKAAGYRVVPTGIDHGTITVLTETGKVELTTLRRDVSTDGRRATVAFSNSWLEDAERRDFTINALNATPDGRIEDPVGGLEDLAAGRVRFIGKAEDRIREDVLRILRYFRFFGRFGFGQAGGVPDAKALAACTSLAHLIPQLSAERIREELLRILVLARVVAVLRVMEQAGVLAHCLAGKADLGRFELFRALEKAPADDAILGLRMLLADDPAAIRAEAVHLKLPNNQRDRLLAAAKPWEPAEGEPAYRLALAVHRAGKLAVADRLWLAAASNLVTPAELSAKLAVIEAQPLRKLPVDGNDLIAAGVEQGPMFRELLGALEEWWFQQGCAPDRHETLAQLRDALGQPKA